MRIPLQSKPLRIALGIICSLIVTVAWLRTFMYPYGWSHCCDKRLFLLLQSYAQSHDGKFPAGEVTPEASLSLLYQRGGSHEGLIEAFRGKSVDVELTRSRLHRGLRLDPDSCGWNYVEGLYADDDTRIAVLWDKAGLGHNGERLLTGGHVVLFLNAETKHIAAKDWSAFETEQKQLRERSLALRAHAGRAKNPANKANGIP